MLHIWLNTDGKRALLSIGTAQGHCPVLWLLRAYYLYCSGSVIACLSATCCFTVPVHLLQYKAKPIHFQGRQVLPSAWGRFSPFYGYFLKGGVIVFPILAFIAMLLCLIWFILLNLYHNYIPQIGSCIVRLHETLRIHSIGHEQGSSHFNPPQSRNSLIDMPRGLSPGWGLPTSALPSLEIPWQTCPEGCLLDDFVTHQTDH